MDKWTTGGEYMSRCPVSILKNAFAVRFQWTKWTLKWTSKGRFLGTDTPMYVLQEHVHNFLEHH